MKHRFRPVTGTPILHTSATSKPRIGWAIPLGVLAGCVVLVLMFVSTSDGQPPAPFVPFVVSPQANVAFDPDALLTASFRDYLGGAR